MIFIWFIVALTHITTGIIDNGFDWIGNGILQVYAGYIILSMIVNIILKERVSLLDQ